MADTVRLYDKLDDISNELSRHGEALKHIDDHLGRLNGSVAKQWAAIGDLQQKEANREGLEKGRSGVLSALTPALWAFVWVVAVMALLNAKQLMALVK